MNLDVSLREFAKSLAPTKDQRRTFNTVIKDLNEILGKEFSPDRTLRGGSYAKGTGLSFSMDLDILIFLNKRKPPFKDLNKEIKGVIEKKLHRGPEDKLKPVNAGEYTVNFYVTRDNHEFKVDIVPAENLVTGPDHGDTSRSQNFETLEIMKHLSELERRYYRSGLTEAAIKFIKNQSAEVHELIRLAKCWLSANIKTKWPGVASLIETIAVHSGSEIMDPGSMDHDGDFDMVVAFRQFLNNIYQIEELRVFFDEDARPGSYRMDQIPDNIRGRPHVVLDPADPYNDRLEQFREGQLKELSDKAEATLEVMKTSTSLREIFRPRPDADDGKAIVKALDSFLSRCPS